MSLAVMSEPPVFHAPSPQQRLAKRIKRAQGDPVEFASLAMAYAKNKVFEHPLQRLIITFAKACIDAGRNCLIQAPPEHGKTSGLLPLFTWFLGHNTSLKVGIVCADAALAKQHLTRMRKLVVSPVTEAAFPEIHPDVMRSQSTKGRATRGEWNQERFFLQGEETPAAEAYKLLGANEGHRIDICWCDDCVTRDVLYSQAIREHSESALIDTFANRTTANGCMIVTNNNWHKDDAIHKFRDSETFASLWIGYEGVDSIKFKIKNPPPAFANHDLEGSLPLWDQWPREKLIEKRALSADSWNRLFAGKTLPPAGSRFPDIDLWPRFEWSENDGNGKIVAFLDIAGGKGAAKDDYAALMVAYRHANGMHDIIDCWVDKASPQAQISACFIMHEKWSRAGYGGIHHMEIEMLGKDEAWLRLLFDAEKKRLMDQNSQFWGLSWSPRHPFEAKELRIERLAPPLSTGGLRFPANLETLINENTLQGRSWRLLQEQLCDWPHGDHDDAPDALAGVTSVELRGEETKTYSLPGVFSV